MMNIQMTAVSTLLCGWKLFFKITGYSIQHAKEQKTKIMNTISLSIILTKFRSAAISDTSDSFSQFCILNPVQDKTKHENIK